MVQVMYPVQLIMMCSVAMGTTCREDCSFTLLLFKTSQSFAFIRSCVYHPPHCMAFLCTCDCMYIMAGAVDTLQIEFRCEVRNFGDGVSVL